MIVLNQIPFFNTFQHKKRGQLVEVNLAGIPLRSVNFYFTDVSEPSHIIFTRSVFILPTSQNRHSSSFSEGKKEVLTIQVGDNESSKYWLSVLNELKNRGVKDILILCADGLSGIKEAISAAFPKTEYQRCIVHQVRNTLKYVPDKDRKAFATDLKTIYQAPDEKKALAALDRVTEKWTPKYPNSMKRWKDNWDAISPIFKFSADVRKVIYTTNAIESLNSA